MAPSINPAAAAGSTPLEKVAPGINPAAAVAPTQLEKVAPSINPAAVGLTPSEQVQMIAMDLEYKVELFNKLTHTCFQKCVEQKGYKEGELHLGETTCIDRCTRKYWKVVDMVGQLLGKAQPPNH